MASDGCLAAGEDWIGSDRIGYDEYIYASSASCNEKKKVRGVRMICLNAV